MSVPAPTLGPCEAWIDGDAVAECCNAEAGSNSEVYDDAAVVASMVLYELSGHQFSGLCSDTVRPCRKKCGCFGPGASMWQWAWATDAYGRESWRNECGQSCGCGRESSVKLAGYPVREITEVKIDGAIVDAGEYRLDEYRYLVRLADPGPPVVARSWPVCQNITLDDDQPGTFSITYTHGVDPPQLGRDAASQLACEIFKACDTSSGECKLPSKVTRVVRQGVTIDRVPSIAELLRSGSTGLTLVDMFIAAQNPGKLTRRPAVWSPDVPAYPRRMT